MIETITLADVERMAAIDRYYAGRADYLLAAAEIVRRIAPPGLMAEDVLEVGAHRLAIVPGSETMDIRPELDPTWLHDARNRPWPMADGDYRLLIALQVFEHLAGDQDAAFEEARRVCSGPILLSAPYRWTCGGDHAGINEDVITGWAGSLPDEMRIIGRANAARILCLWRRDHD